MMRCMESETTASGKPEGSAFKSSHNHIARSGSWVVTKWVNRPLAVYAKEDKLGLHRFKVRDEAYSALAEGSWRPVERFPAQY